MSINKFELFDAKMEKTVGRWWFILIILIIFFIPSYSEMKLPPEESMNVVKQVLSNPLIYSNSIFYGLIKIVFIFITVMLFFRRTLFSKIFNYFCAVVLIITAVFQNAAFTHSYGFVFLIGNFVLMLMVACMWIFQGIGAKKNRLKEHIDKAGTG